LSKAGDRLLLCRTVHTVKNVLLAALAGALLFAAGAPAVAHRHKAPAVTVDVAQPGQRVAIAHIDEAPVGADVTVIGYFSHKADETDGDLQVYLIDHRGNYVVVEAPRRFRAMKYYIRGRHFHRNDIVIARGTLTRQLDKPTERYPAGWMELNPVTSIEHYHGALPPDLHYTRVRHHFLGKTTTVQS